MKGTMVALALAMCLGFLDPLRASESFTLDIPLRGNASQETGEVRIKLGLDAPPSGAQLVVGGTTTLNLGDTATVAGDSVTFAAGSGNEARITYRPLSNFGSDFCAGAGAVPKSIAMRFAGSQDVVDYRIATYVVAAPLAECSQPSKHTGDAPATITPVDDGTAPALTAIDKGRDTFDVVIVLDKSGSMADLPPGANAGPTKAQLLVSAAQAFVANWEQLDLPIGGAEWSHDRIGLVFFSSTAVAQSLAGADPPANFFVQRGASTAWDAVVNGIGALTPGGSTSIGGGINAAMQQWKADPQSDLSLIVVTDGIQNTAPLILPTGTGFLGLDPVSGLPQELRQRFIPIQTLGFGMPAAVDETLLRNIAFETAGVSYLDVNASTMFDSLALTLVALLKGNTAALGIRRQSTLIGNGPSSPQPVTVDQSARRVVFSLQWQPPAANVLDLEVFPPGKTTPAVPSSTKRLPQTSIQTFDLAPGDAGTWSVRVKRDAKSNLERVPYTLNAFFLEEHLDYQLSLTTMRPTTGDKIGIRAVVDWDGKRLAGLPPGAIRVRLQRPTESLGTILHRQRAVSGRPITTAGDPQSALDRKLRSFKGRSLLDRIEPKDVATIVLTEEAKGVYSATFDQTSIAGQYAFEVVLDWDNERTGHVHREERLEQFVGVRADPGRTDVRLTPSSGAGWRITVTPRDRFGNYLGPGYATLVRASLKGPGKLRDEVPVDRDQTGTYVFEVTDIPSGTKPAVLVTVDGVAVGRN